MRLGFASLRIVDEILHGRSRILRTVAGPLHVVGVRFERLPVGLALVLLAEHDEGIAPMLERQHVGRKWDRGARRSRHRIAEHR